MLKIAQEDAVQRARAALLASPVFALQELDVDIRGERLTISGKVNCFYHKQLAQEVVRNVAEGIRLTNAVSVEDTRSRPNEVDEPSFIG